MRPIDVWSRLPLLALGAVLLPDVLTAQGGEGGAPQEARPPRLFASSEPIEFTLTADMRAILRDKAEEPEWRDGTISYAEEGDTVRRPVGVRTRGLFRLRYCTFPPLRLNFVKDSVKGTLFARQDKPKLGTHCRDHDEFEQYAVQEYLLYRIYNVLTPLSFRARLARVTYVDAAGAMKPVTRWGFLVEDPGDLAARIDAIRDDRPGTLQTDLDPREAVLMGMFQYLIGNTDWSVPALHNIELYRREGRLALAIPYDFDWSGAISTRYARPDPSLRITRVTQRVWRGVCPTPEALQETIALFNEKRPEIEALFRDFAPLDPKNARRMLRYFEDFYEIVNTPRLVQREFIDPCRAY